MDFNPKDLKKLADACRKAGIKSFKGCGVEFTLTEDAPTSNYKRRKAAPKIPTAPTLNDNLEFESDSPTPEQLLMWSAMGAPGVDEDASEGAEQ